MFTIRLRVIFLSLVSFIFFLMVVYNEYKIIQKEFDEAQTSLSIIERTLFFSQLIHPLQKERGLTAARLIETDPYLYDRLLKQRIITDAHFEKALRILKVQERGATENFMIELKDLRTKVDENKANWKEVNQLYTSKINYYLKLISLKLVELEHTKVASHQLYSVLYLAIARENIALTRANMMLGFQRGEILRSELLEINQQYSEFNNAFGTFKLHMQKAEYTHLLPAIESDALLCVKKEVELVLEGDAKALQGGTIKWWREVTAVIDAMKDTEELLKEHITRSSQETIAHIKEHIINYAIITLIVLIVIFWITLTTVLRIFKALFILIKTLNQVENTHDFGLRVNIISKDEFGVLGRSINQLLVFTEAIVKEKEMLASVDLLTGAMNRRSFMKAAEVELERHKRYNSPMSLIFCDIDKFKLINDKYGHAVGDDVLAIFTKTIQENLRSSDYLSRWGGEEFIILTPQTNEKDAVELAESLRKIIMMLSVGPVKSFTCSFGVAELREGESFDELCERVDKAMYQAKNTGRNRVCTSDS